MPKKARNYIEKVCKLTGVKPAIVSTGPRRDETIILEQPFKRVLRKAKTRAKRSR